MYDTAQSEADAAMLDHFPSRATKATFIAIAALALLFAVIALASVANQVGRTAPGFVVWDNLVVPAVTTSGWATPDDQIPLRSVVTHVDDRRVVSAEDLRERIRASPPGTVFRYRFRHDQQSRETHIPSATLRWADVMPFVVPYFSNGIILFLTALIVFYFRPEHAASRAFLGLAVTFGGMLLLALDAFSSFWLQRVCFVLDSMVPGALLNFALCFPEERTLVKRRPWLKPALYLPFVPLASLQNVFLMARPFNHLRVSGWVYTADALAALVVVASLAETFWRSPNVVARQQVKAVAAGIALACIVPAILIMATVLYGAEIPFNPLTIFLIVFPMSIGYAIARHNLFEVDRFLRLGVVYGILTVVVFAVYAGLVLAGNFWIGRDSPWANGLVPIYLIVVVLIADPLRARVQRVVDRLFYRQTYNYRSTVEDASRALATLLDTDQIASTLLDTIVSVVAIEWGGLLVLGSHEAEDRVFAQGPALDGAKRSLVDGAVARRLAARDGVATLYELSRERPQRLAASDLARLEEIGSLLTLPLSFERHPVGLVLLGGKQSGAFYSEDDVHLVQTLAHQAALALENARAYEALRRAQADLVAAERMAAVGELAATVAHGIRNPLAGIRVAAQVAQDEPSDTDAVGESLTDIISEVDRLEQRVRAILELARPFDPDLVAHDVRVFLESFLAHVRHRIPDGIVASVRVADDLPRARFDAARVVEVMDVLVNNACEAMNAKGTILLGARRCDRGVAIEVRDDGPGIDAARLSRVFDLFYTTKSSGTGVGLAMAKRLMERQGGSIEASSEVGVGTTFTLVVPAEAS